MTQVTKAYVTSAVPLSESQLYTLREVLSRKAGKEVEISQSVDTSLIGGLYILLDGREIDYTVKRQLQEMKSSIR